MDPRTDTLFSGLPFILAGKSTVFLVTFDTAVL
jgi:hypothetical protein